MSITQILGEKAIFKGAHEFMRIIAGSAKRRKLKSPRGRNIRPTSDKVREALFSILGTAVAGANFLDLFAGSGGVGLEALSRGARVTMVEKSPVALALLKVNLTNCRFDVGVSACPQAVVARRLVLRRCCWGQAPTLQRLETISNFQLVTGDALHFVRRLAKSPPVPAYDFIFADPPYTSDLADSLLSELASNSLSPDGWLIIEHRTRQRPNCSDTPWEREREAVYGKTALSFYRRRG